MEPSREPHPRCRRRFRFHQHCFGSAASYGIDAVVARKALSLLEEGMNMAENDDVKRRVESFYFSLASCFESWVDRCIQKSSQLAAPLADYLRQEVRQYNAAEQASAPRHISAPLAGKWREAP